MAAADRDRAPAGGRRGLEDAHGLDDHHLATILESLAPALDEAQAASAVKAADAMRDPVARLSALLALAPRLPPDDAEAVLAHALRSVETLEDEFELFQDWFMLASALPERFLGDLLEAIAAHDEPLADGWILRSLAPRLPGELVPVAIDLAGGIDDAHERAVTLAMLAEGLDKSERRSAVARALESIAREPPGPPTPSSRRSLRPYRSTCCRARSRSLAS